MQALCQLAGHDMGRGGGGDGGQMEEPGNWDAILRKYLLEGQSLQGCPGTETTPTSKDRPISQEEDIRLLPN